MASTGPVVLVTLAALASSGCSEKVAASDEVRAAFDADVGKVRVLMLVAPS